MRRFGSGFRAVAAALGLLSVLATTPAAGASSGVAQRYVALRVATYNIHAGAGADGQFDTARIVAALHAMDADVIGLQEVDVHWDARSQWRDLATEIATALDMAVFFAPIYRLDPPAAGAPYREYGLAILSRHRIHAARNHEITRLSTQDPNPAPAPAPGFPEVEINVRGAQLHVYATHLDYRADPAVRKLQVADTQRIMAEDCRGDRCGNQVLLGDFNARPDAPELAPLWEKLTDAWAAVGAGDGFTFPANAPDRRIDYMTASRGIRITTAVVPQTLASDHLPVVADLLVPRAL